MKLKIKTNWDWSTKLDWPLELESHPTDGLGQLTDVYFELLARIDILIEEAPPMKFKRKGGGVVDYIQELQSLWSILADYDTCIPDDAECLRRMLKIAFHILRQLKQGRSIAEPLEQLTLP